MALVLIFYFQHQIPFQSVLSPSHFQFLIAYSMQKLVRRPGEVVTMVDVLQAVGTVPDRLNSLVSTGVILEAVILSNFPVIPSGPHPLVVPNAF